MTRFLSPVLFVLPCAMLGATASPENPPQKLTPEERKELETRWAESMVEGGKAFQAKMFPAAQKAALDALELARRLYPKGEFPDGHSNLAMSLNNLGMLYKNLGKRAAAEPLLKDALEMRRSLFKGDHPAVANSLNSLGLLYMEQGKWAEAEPLFKDALEMRRRLIKGDHPDIALSLNNLGGVYQEQAKYAKAEPCYKEALAMAQRLFEGDHPEVARCSNNLALLYQNQGRLAEAEPLFKDALAMTQRLFEGDNPLVAFCLNNLALLYQAQGKFADAELLSKDALEMRKRLFTGNHPDIALSLNNLALVYKAQGKLAEAEPLYKDALEMTRRLFKGDHRDLAICLSNLAALYRDQERLDAAEPLLRDALAMFRRLHKEDNSHVVSALSNLAFLFDAQGKLAEAEPLLKEALAMTRRLFEGDNRSVVNCLGNLAFLYQAQGKWAEAELLLKDALGMSQRMTIAYAKQKAEGESLNFTASLPQHRDGLLSLAQLRMRMSPTPYDPATIYPVLWTAKGTLARVYEQRQLQARAASVDPALTRMLEQLAGARRSRAELLLAPATKDPVALKRRAAELRAFDDTIAQLTRTLSGRFPTSARADKLDAATLADLQKALPADAAVVDFYRYTLHEFDNTKPVRQKQTYTARYLAFVATRDAVVWVELDTAAQIEPAIRAWRQGITGGKEIPAAIPAKVRELVWQKVRKKLPATIKTAYLCPDADLCAVPFAALPGDNPGTILLEDFAVATIPHAPFLLDKLWPQEPIANPPPGRLDIPMGALVVGGVKYDAELAPNPPATVSPGPLLKPGQKVGWRFLPGTATESHGVGAAAVRKNIPATRIESEKATATAILAALPKVKYAHFATHGFFADPSFRSVFQLDEQDYRVRGVERIGKAVNSPLVMTGLVFAGANNSKTPGRGIVTGEQLIDLDLSGLELAVLSACETGLGDVAGGEGAYGLQRAFHYAGTRDVVASLWKVPDRPTAALMALFYQNLWEKNLSPMESLRQAQREIYRNPAKIPELAKAFRGKFEEVEGKGGEVEIEPSKDGKAHPLLWAAFTLSGPGR